jgi:hypothetical protein
LQSEIVELEKTREAMAQELVSLSNKNDNLQEQLRDYPAFKQKYKVSTNIILSTQGLVLQISCSFYY